MTTQKDISSKEEVIRELIPSKGNFEVDRFEHLILQDITQNDESTAQKLHRNLTDMFNDWINQKVRAKEQIKINIKGETRSGKSLVGMKISKKITDQYNRSFDANRIICANQKELRQKLQEADFGEVKQVDENAFANTGVGSHVEMQQLKDINNIIAKQNIHMIYITPRNFLDTGATLGLSYFGKDTDNWLSRFLLYSLKGGNPVLLGYVTFDVGSLFRETGCLMYHSLGGCTNPSQKKKEDIPERFLKHSDCVPKDYDPEKIRDDGKVCPFYDICKSAMAQYEHKKDSWIAREMRGDLDERTRERYELAVTCLKIFGVLDDDGGGREVIKLTASNQKDMRNKVKAKLPRLANTKLTITEQEEILSIIQSMTNVSFLKDICEMLNMDFEELKTYLSTEPWEREDPAKKKKDEDLEEEEGHTERTDRQA